ncbi:dessication-induced 1VOC superfamily protein [Euphorbia peplus]|nr:dessication-induced 1VOC superfamily protein [Euphorbia peplus]
MGSNLNPAAFAYTILYVKDVAKSVDFYAKAFGYHVRRVDDSHRWGELDSGNTTIAFTPIHQYETDYRTGHVHIPKSSDDRPPLELCFDYTDVDAAYKRAVENGAVAASPPEDKEWGQRVGYVRDLDGIVVRMGSHVSKPAKQD